ncbi:MAG: site-specific integrase [Clostridia bacterium]|nr:site-specific integrase [Clostridia bacterium]
MKYEKFLNIWMEDYVKIKNKKRTTIVYKNLIEKHIKPQLGKLSLKHLNMFVLQIFLNKLINSGNARNGCGLSSSTIQMIMVILKSSMNMAEKLELIKTNPTINLIRPKTIKKRVECFSLEEQKMIEKYVFNHRKNKPYYLGIIICLYTGIRIGELLALKWEDIDFNNQILMITKACYEGKDENGLYTKIIDTPKTICSTRNIPLPNQVVELLNEMKRTSKSDYIISKNGKDIMVRSYQRSFESILRKLNINHKGFHSLRHTFATRAIELGMDIKTLSEILGHKNASITLNTYAHSLNKHKREMMNNIGSIMEK